VQAPEEMTDPSLLGEKQELPGSLTSPVALLYIMFCDADPSHGKTPTRGGGGGDGGSSIQERSQNEAHQASEAAFLADGEGPLTRAVEISWRYFVVSPPALGSARTAILTRKFDAGDAEESKLGEVRESGVPVPSSPLPPVIPSPKIRPSRGSVNSPSKEDNPWMCMLLLKREVSPLATSFTW